jgi:PadR family transcriptional regulator PadR
MGKLSRLIEPVILLFVEQRPGSYGYDLAKAFEEFSLTDSIVDPGAIYRTLHQLEQAKMVRSSWSPGGIGPRRKCYTITPQGSQHLRDWALLIDKRSKEMQGFLELFRETTTSSPRT